MDRSASRSSAFFLAAAISLVAPRPAPAQESKPAASVTVFPVLLGGSASSDVANVVGMMLEHGGLTEVEVAATPFVPDRKLGFQEQAAAFAAFAKQAGVKTGYALFADFLGTPKTGVAEVRGVLADASGVVWSEQQKPGVAAFDRKVPHEPLECCVLLVERLREPLRLADPFRANAPEGKLGTAWKLKTGVPPQAELDAMQRRLAEFEKLGANAVVTVHPPRVGTEWASASDLAARLVKAGYVHAKAGGEPVRFVADPSPNEQRTLWSGAVSIQKAMRAAGEPKGYSLFCDFLMRPDGKAHAVHTYLLSPAGELVVVDFQNSHHDDFTRIAPDSVAKCCELAALRIAKHLR